MGVEGKANDKELTEKLDEYLKAPNKNYQVARGKALKGVVVKTIEPAVFYDWNAANQEKGGQVKTEKVMGGESSGNGKLLWKRIDYPENNPSG